MSSLESIEPLVKALVLYQFLMVVVADADPLVTLLVLPAGLASAADPLKDPDCVSYNPRYQTCKIYTLLTC